jgi:hypothetical protein
MKTKTEIIEIIKTENLNGLRTGSDETGYTDLTSAEYELQVAEWADGRLAKLAQEAAAEQAAIDKAALLAKLGITADEFKTLLG